MIRLLKNVLTLEREKPKLYELMCKLALYQSLPDNFRLFGHYYYGGLSPLVSLYNKYQVMKAHAQN